MAVNNKVGFAKKSNTHQSGLKLGEYQQHGKPSLVSILSESKGELTVVDAQNSEFPIAANRIFQLPGRVPPQFAHRSHMVSYLRELGRESNKIKENVRLDKAWETFKSHSREIPLEQIQKELFPNQNLANFLGVRWALLSDKFYFKRGKTGFSPRPGDSVESIKEAVLAQEKKRALIEEWAASIATKSLDDQLINYLEKVATLGRKVEICSEIEDLIEILHEKKIANLSGRIEDQCFQLLLELGIFSKHQNLAPIKLGRTTSFSQVELGNAATLPELLGEVLSQSSRTDLTHLETMTIDGEDTRDFDDALSIEKEGDNFKIGIHIADVSSFIRPEELLWKTALKRGATIYTADQNFPMLPHRVSEDLLSLVQGEERAAISIFIIADSDCNLISSEIKKSKIKVKRRISYNELDKEFELGTENPNLLFLWTMSQNLESERISNGAKTLPKREMTPVIDENGNVRLETLNEETPARKLVGEMMILANHTLANFAKNNDIAFIYRQQEESDPSIEQQAKQINPGAAQEYALRGSMKRSLMTCNPGPHSGLALDCYTQCTSPIRRFTDLINQYQINQFLGGEKMLEVEYLESTIESLDTSVSEVTYIQRNRHRYWLLTYLQQNNISKIQGTVVRIEGPKPLVELDNLYFISQFFPLKKGELRLGDRVSIKVDQIAPRTDRLKLNECDG